MAGITLATAQARLDAWLAADEAVARNQSYSVAGRSLTRANASEIRENISYWEQKVAALSRGGIRVRYATGGG
jgi:hypothetical protein